MSNAVRVRTGEVLGRAVILAVEAVGGTGALRVEGLEGLWKKSSSAMSLDTQLKWRTFSLASTAGQSVSNLALNSCSALISSTLPLPLPLPLGLGATGLATCNTGVAVPLAAPFLPAPCWVAAAAAAAASALACICAHCSRSGSGRSSINLAYPSAVMLMACQVLSFLKGLPEA